MTDLVTRPESPSAQIPRADIAPADTSRAETDPPGATEREALTRHVVERYQQGASLTTISGEIGRSYGFVRRLLLDAGVRPRPRGGSRPRRRDR